MLERGVASTRSLISVSMDVKPHHPGNLLSGPLKPGWSTNTGKRAIIAALLFCTRTSGPTKTTALALMVATAPSYRDWSKNKSCPMASWLPVSGKMMLTTPLGASWRFVMPLKELRIELTTLLNAHLLEFMMMLSAASDLAAAAAAFSASVPVAAFAATVFVAWTSAATSGPSGYTRFAPRSNCTRAARALVEETEVISCRCTALMIWAPIVRLLARSNAWNCASLSWIRSAPYTNTAAAHSNPRQNLHTTGLEHNGTNRVDIFSTCFNCSSRIPLICRFISITVGASSWGAITTTACSAIARISPISHGLRAVERH
mmetsp:Transcript_48372/g.137374  ORF Transcript_48372/g.137374 Transcript_48372/m.137374 type:complete len:317 (+) Transcript_48372:767-1717(+)